MKLVDLKLTKAEAKAEIGSSAPSKGPRYPWGLSLRLDNDTLGKLKLDALKVGTKVTIEAIATVTEYGEHQRQDGEERHNLELQITELAIGEPKRERQARKSDAHLAAIGQPARNEE